MKFVEKRVQVGAGGTGLGDSKNIEVQIDVLTLAEIWKMVNKRMRCCGKQLEGLMIMQSIILSCLIFRVA